MSKVLVILAAGIGSRFSGGIKQLETVDENGHIIMDFSIHDAIMAGFDKIVFIIRHDIEDDFKMAIGDRIEKKCSSLGVEVEYAFQELDNFVEKIPEERKKPWGTGHAVLSSKNVVDSPFAVINADDYYGKNSFKMASEFLSSSPQEYALVGYKLKNTLSENGGVTRGVCEVSDGKLIGIKETKNIVKKGLDAEANGNLIDIDSLVSMNFWCYPMKFLDELEKGFKEFQETMEDPMKDEFLLPILADDMIRRGVEFKVLPTNDKWFGVTYKEDKPLVSESIKNLIISNEYREDLYSDL